MALPLPHHNTIQQFMILLLMNYIFQRSVFLPAKTEVNVFHQTHVIARSHTLVRTVSTSENAASASLPPPTTPAKSATLSE